MLKAKEIKSIDYTWKHEAVGVPDIEVSDEVKKEISSYISKLIKYKEKKIMRQLVGMPVLQTNEEVFRELWPWGIPEDKEKAMKYAEARIKELYPT